MTDQELVKQCFIDIYKRNGYDDPSILAQRDYEHISEEIETRTGTLISVSTIKRLQHGRFSRLPQTATLNAISKYLGYNSWQEYKASLKKHHPFSFADVENKVKINASPKLSERLKKFRLAGLLSMLVGGITIAGFIGFSSRKTDPGFDKAVFSVKKNTSDEVPNTVVFTYDVDAVDADSFFIQQSWDINRRVKVFKKTHTLTDIYYVPGYHTAKLIANDSIIRTIDVSIPTDSWFMYAKGKDPKSNPEYIKVNNMIKNGIFALTPADLAHSQIDIQPEKTYIYSFFPSKLEVNSDDYTLRTRLRMKEVRNNFCPYIMLEVFCQKRFMFFTGTPKGCSSESVVLFGETYIPGKTNDLSALGYDVREWTEIELSVRNKQVKIILDGKEAFSTSYKNTSGLITGLGFISNGLCEVDYVDLKGLDGKVVYQNDFSLQ